MKKILFSLYISLALGAINPGFSMAHGIDSLVKEHKIDGIRFLSGGVGQGERKAMRQMAKDYDLKLIFALQSGAYLSSVRVAINEPGGKKILETVSNGPWLFAYLPRGRYEIIVSRENQKQIRKVEIGEGIQRVMFHWKH